LWSSFNDKLDHFLGPTDDYEKMFFDPFEARDNLKKTWGFEVNVLHYEDLRMEQMKKDFYSVLRRK